MLHSCNTKHTSIGKIIESNIDEIEVNPPINQTINFSSIFKHINIIPLESTQQAYLSAALKIEKDSNLFFIQNKHDKLIYVFNTNGDFQYRIGNIGQGPGEVSQPTTFALNKQRKTITINDNYNSILTYDIKGNFLHKETLDLFFKEFVIQSDFYYYHASKLINYDDESGNPMCWNLWTNKNSKINTFFTYDYNKYPNGSMYFDTKTPFSYSKGQYFYHHVFSDTIYVIEQNNLSPKYTLNLRESTTLLEDMTGEEAYTYLTSKESQPAYLHDVIVLDDFIKYKYLAATKLYEGIYSIKNKSTKEGIFNNDIFGSSITFIYSYGNKLVGLIDPSDIEITSIAHDLLDEKNFNKIKQANTDDNLLLIECLLN